MFGGIVQSLRKQQHAIVRWMMAVLVLPLLLGLLPPQLSAAESLERDIAASRCLDGGAAVPAHPEDHQKHQALCILCTSGCATHGAVLVNITAASSPIPARPAPAVLLPAYLAPAATVFRDGNRPRGPPSLS